MGGSAAGEQTLGVRECRGGVWGGVGGTGDGWGRGEVLRGRVGRVG